MWFEALIGHRIWKLCRLFSTYFRDSETNVTLENWSLAKLSEKSSCEVKRGQRIVLFVGFQLTLTQDVVPDDLCTHDMSTVITRLFTIVESRHQFVPIDVFLTSSCLRLIHLKNSDDPVRRIRSSCSRWWRENIWNCLLTIVMSLIRIMFYKWHLFLTDIFKSLRIFWCCYWTTCPYRLLILILCTRSLCNVNLVLCNTYHFRCFSVNVEHHFLQSSWWSQFSPREHFAEICPFSFHTGRFFRDVALIDFFVLEGKSCFVSLSVPQMRLSATCQSSCAWSNRVKLSMRRYCGRKTDETMMKNLSSTSRRCCVCALVQDVCEPERFPRSIPTLSDWLKSLRSWFVSIP